MVLGGRRYILVNTLFHCYTYPFLLLPYFANMALKYSLQYNLRSGIVILVAFPFVTMIAGKDWGHSLWDLKLV